MNIKKIINRQNIIALLPMAALAVIPCAVSCAYHSISGTLVAAWFQWRDKVNAPNVSE